MDNFNGIDLNVFCNDLKKIESGLVSSEEALALVVEFENILSETIKEIRGNIRISRKTRSYIIHDKFRERLIENIAKVLKIHGEFYSDSVYNDMINFYIEVEEYLYSMKEKLSDVSIFINEMIRYNKYDHVSDFFELYIDVYSACHNMTTYANERCKSYYMFVKNGINFIPGNTCSPNYKELLGIANIRYGNIINKMQEETHSKNLKID